LHLDVFGEDSVDIQATETTDLSQN
jgi:hypothetical protein